MKIFKYNWTVKYGLRDKIDNFNISNIFRGKLHFIVMYIYVYLLFFLSITDVAKVMYYIFVKVIIKCGIQSKLYMCERSKQTKLKCNNENWKVKLIRVRRETSFSDLSRFWLSCLDPLLYLPPKSFPIFRLWAYLMKVSPQN